MVGWALLSAYRVARALLLVYRIFFGVGKNSLLPFSISRTSTMVGRSAGLN
uniref:Uncharacterized protein n=1 Tax=Arundo donax TaxID=35708 RepID=A0A0A8YNR0_ARUDO